MSDRKEITKAERQALEPFGIVIAGIYEAMRDKDEDALNGIIEAASHVSQTNCWWATFRAAPIVIEAAKEALSEKARLTAEAPQP